MIKAIIVDDEVMEREGMRRTIDWEKHGFLLCGEADNGLTGLELAFKVKPDLVITDIRMPGIDGISMSKKIKEKLPYCSFIIITGYNDFEYARRAVKINAFDFLLKPIDEEELLNAIERAFIVCSKIKRDMDITVTKNLLDIMRGNISGRKDIDTMLSSYGINKSNILIVSFLNNNFEINKSSELIKDTIRKYFNMNSYVIECHADRIALVITDVAPQDMDNINKIIHKVQKEVYEVNNIIVTVGISDILSIYDMKKAYIESKDALKYRMYMGRGSIIQFSGIKKEKSVYWDKITDMVKDIMVKLKVCDKAALNIELKKLYFDLFKENNIDNSIVRQTSIEIILRGTDVLISHGIPSEKFFGNDFNIYQSTFKLETVAEIYSFVNSILIRILEAVKEKNISFYEDGMEDALQFIKEHFNEDISLNDVAKVAYLNESYLSRKIKKMLGVGFVEYITKLRMEKAMEYLKNPNIKITEISHKIGYQDYRYFSHKFKEYTGYLPSEWKEKQR